jgi:exonuclease III
VTVELRVLSWNVHGLRDDQQALTRIVRDLDPDVMWVQEAP